MADTVVQANFDALATVSLTVTRSGTGAGSVSGGSGMDCGTTCTRAYLPGTQVTLTAAPDDNSVFSGWTKIVGLILTGGCTGTDTSCSFAINADTTVDAAFVRGNLALEVASQADQLCIPTGCATRWFGGTITGTSSVATPTAISCTQESSAVPYLELNPFAQERVVRCVFALPEGATVSLVATPYAGWLDAWSGCDAPGTDPTTGAATCPNVQTSFAPIPTVRARFRTH